MSNVYTLNAASVVKNEADYTTIHGDKDNGALLLKLVNLHFDTSGALAAIDSTKPCFIYNADAIKGFTSLTYDYPESDYDGAYRAFSYEALTEKNYLSEDNPNVYYDYDPSKYGYGSARETRTVDTLTNYRYFFFSILDAAKLAALPTSITLNYLAATEATAPTSTAIPTDWPAVAKSQIKTTFGDLPSGMLPYLFKEFSSTMETEIQTSASGTKSPMFTASFGYVSSSEYASYFGKFTAAGYTKLRSGSYGQQTYTEFGKNLPDGSKCVELEMAYDSAQERMYIMGMLQDPLLASWPSDKIATFFGVSSDPYLAITGGSAYVISPSSSSGSTEMEFYVMGLASDPSADYIASLTKAGWVVDAFGRSYNGHVTYYKDGFAIYFDFETDMMMVYLSRTSTVAAFPAEQIAAAYPSLALPTLTAGTAFSFGKTASTSGSVTTTRVYVQVAGLTVSDSQNYAATLLTKYAFVSTSYDSTVYCDSANGYVITLHTSEGIITLISIEDQSTATGETTYSTWADLVTALTAEDSDRGKAASALIAMDGVYFPSASYLLSGATFQIIGATSAEVEAYKNALLAAGYALDPIADYYVSPTPLTSGGDVYPIVRLRKPAGVLNICSVFVYMSDESPADVAAKYSVSTSWPAAAITSAMSDTTGAGDAIPAAAGTKFILEKGNTNSVNIYVFTTDSDAEKTYKAAASDESYGFGNDGTLRSIDLANYSKKLTLDFGAIQQNEDGDQYYRISYQYDKDLTAPSTSWPLAAEFTSHLYDGAYSKVPSYAPSGALYRTSAYSGSDSDGLYYNFSITVANVPATAEADYAALLTANGYTLLPGTYFYRNQDAKLDIVTRSNDSSPMTLTISITYFPNFPVSSTTFPDVSAFTSVFGTDGSDFAANIPAVSGSAYDYTSANEGMGRTMTINVYGIADIPTAIANEKTALEAKGFVFDGEKELAYGYHLSVKLTQVYVTGSSLSSGYLRMTIRWDYKSTFNFTVAPTAADINSWLGLSDTTAVVPLFENTVVPSEATSIMLLGEATSSLQLRYTYDTAIDASKISTYIASAKSDYGFEDDTANTTSTCTVVINKTKHLRLSVENDGASVIWKLFYDPTIA
jgi:hypothetical protein